MRTNPRLCEMTAQERGSSPPPPAAAGHCGRDRARRTRWRDSPVPRPPPGEHRHPAVAAWPNASHEAAAQMARSPAAMRSMRTQPQLRCLRACARHADRIEDIPYCEALGVEGTCGRRPCGSNGLRLSTANPASCGRCLAVRRRGLSGLTPPSCSPCRGRRRSASSLAPLAEDSATCSSRSAMRYPARWSGCGRCRLGARNTRCRSRPAGAEPRRRLCGSKRSSRASR